MFSDILMGQGSPRRESSFKNLCLGARVGKLSCRAFAWPVPDPGFHPRHCHKTKHRELSKWVNFTENKKYSGARWPSQLVGRLRQEDHQLEASWGNLQTLSLNGEGLGV